MCNKTIQRLFAMTVQDHVPHVQRLHNGIPLLRRIEAHPWENKVTFNPACTLVDDKGALASIIPRLPFDEQIKSLLSAQPALCFLLYRAQGKKTDAYDHTRSSIGLAILTPDLKLLARHTEPSIVPDKNYEDLGVEDGRITRVGNKFVMFYCAYSSGKPANKMRIALASTNDFAQWEKHGLLKGEFNTINNKNAMLFPDRLNQKFVLLHRPIEGLDAMAIHWAEADDIFGEWRTRGLLMRPIKNPAFVDTWIGGGAPPLRLHDGRYLLLYHIGNKKDTGTLEYHLGIAVIDPFRKEPIIRRNEPLLRPETLVETNGDAELGVNNIVFLCGAYFYDGDLYFPYAGADSVILGGKISKKDIEQYVDS